YVVYRAVLSSPGHVCSFVFSAPSTTEIYSLSLHDALPISYIRRAFVGSSRMVWRHIPPAPGCHLGPVPWPRRPASSCHVLPPSRSEEHTSELQSRVDLVCRLLLEKKKQVTYHNHIIT